MHYTYIIRLYLYEVCVFYCFILFILSCFGKFCLESFVLLVVRLPPPQLLATSTAPTHFTYKEAMPRLTRAASANAEIKSARDADKDAPLESETSSGVETKSRSSDKGTEELGKTSIICEKGVQEEQGSKPDSQLGSKPQPTSSEPSGEPRLKETPTATGNRKGSQKLPDLTYIPPQNRRLGVYEDDLEPPHPMIDSANVIDFELRKLVGLVVYSTDKSFTGEFLQETTTLAAQFMETFASTLRKLTDLQRHQFAGVADVELCLDKLGIPANDLYKEYVRCKTLSPPVRQQAVRLKSEVERMLHDYHAEKYVLEKEDPSYVFYTNEQYEIAALIPQQSRSRDYIPEYFPELPPDFTYRLTSSFMDTMTELKKIKMKLFEESRLNEASLYKLIDDDEKRWIEELDEQLGSISDDDSDDQRAEIMSASADHPSDIESPLPDLEDVIKQKANDYHKDEEGASKVADSKETVATIAMPIDTSVKSIDSKLEEPTTNEDESNLIESQLLELAEPSTADKPVLKLSFGLKTHSSNDLSSNTSPDALGATKLRSENRFDIVAYARQKRLALERPVKELERQRERRRQNYYLQAETMFSCYATKIPSRADIKHFDEILDNSFKNVIRATRRAERTKKKKLARMEEERKRLELEHEKLSGTLEFAFNNETNFLDDSDDDHAHLFEFGDFGDNHTQTVGEAQQNGVGAHNGNGTVLNGNTPVPSASEAQPSQLSIAPVLGDGDKMEVDDEAQGSKMDNFDEGIDDMLEELELLPATTWEAKPAESESEEDELEDFL